MTSHTPTLSSTNIRELFLNYFKERNHTIVPSSSLIPSTDPTLLFTNAGMVQFKDVFLGQEQRDYSRAASTQRCVRAGGKHNDLERVGYTARHHTFFEMLGNFSFGDYFKKEAIKFSWEFLTQTLKLPAEKLWVTVYKDDKDAENIWLNEMQIDPTRFSRCGDEDNFWAMGPTGPCGPCTEIFYDHGSDIPGGPPGSPDADGDRYIEIWNLVFMQYNRAEDGTLAALPKPSVDTGMGLERLTAVLQHKKNNFDTDLFQPLIQAAAKLANTNDTENFSLRVIADHIRSCSFLICDGVNPSNEGRGYVLRRIIRRALRHGHKLGITEIFFYKLVAVLCEIMGEAFPELIKSKALIEKTLRQEEEQFNLTLSQGLKLLDQEIAKLKTKMIPGEVVFKLYDTYGFPADLTADIGREKCLEIDYPTFEILMTQQRDRSRQSSQFKTEYFVAEDNHPATIFLGHEHIADKNQSAKILAIYQNGKFVERLNSREQASIVLDKTPFYAESGGQVGDQGLLKISDTVFFKVFDTIKQGHTHLHLGKLDKGTLSIGDTVEAIIDDKRRAATVLNHTATHILHHVLKKILGPHVIQKGSLVEPERLRFDFSHSQSVTADELQQIEKMVNAEIRANHAAVVEETTPDEAVAKGAIALFGEKYGKKVRVVNFGSSMELCGGTHASHTGDVGFFKITSESGVAAGIRRIEAVTGEAALDYIDKKEMDYQTKLAEAQEKSRALEKEIQAFKDRLTLMASKDISKQAKPIGASFILAERAETLDGKALRIAIDQLKQELKSAIIILATVKDNKIGIVGGVTADLQAKVSAKDLVSFVATQVGGKGGGKVDLAEGGGNQPEALEKALQSVYTWAKDRLETH